MPFAERHIARRLRQWHGRGGESRRALPTRASVASRCERFQRGTCQAQCLDTGTQTKCVNGDGCCPTTGCNATTDDDCPPVCGNGVIEPPETCDGNCPTAVTCVDDSNNIRRFDPGSAASCDETCTSTSRPCQADGWCPTSCNSSNDVDCAPTNDLCKGAVDITNGGTFAVEITNGARQDATEQCSDKGAEVSTPHLKGSEFVYLAALDGMRPQRSAARHRALTADFPRRKERAAALCDQATAVSSAGARVFRHHRLDLGATALSGSLRATRLAGAGRWASLPRAARMRAAGPSRRRRSSPRAGNNCQHGDQSARSARRTAKTTLHGFKCPTTPGIHQCKPETTSTPCCPTYSARDVHRQRANA